MAAADDAERVTGYMTGGISPFGQRRRLRTFADSSPAALESVFVNAGAATCRSSSPPRTCWALEAPLAA